MYDLKKKMRMYKSYVCASIGFPGVPFAKKPQRLAAGLLGVLESISLYKYNTIDIYIIHTHRDNKMLYYINNVKSILYNIGIAPRIFKVEHFNGVLPT